MFLILNPESDEHTSGIVTEIFNSLPLHWQAMMPKNIEVKIANCPFDQIYSLSEFCASREKEEGQTVIWRCVQTACTSVTNSERATIWIYNLDGPDINLRSQFKETLVRLIWNAEKAHLERHEFTYEWFVDACIKFLWNRQYLYAEKTNAWEIMIRLDGIFETRKYAATI